MIAIGVIAGVAYMAIVGKSEAGLSFDQANALFLYLFAAAFLGGKVFLFFEEPAYYAANPGKLVSGQGFVFYGSFLFTVPTMLWYFRKEKLSTHRMLDVMAVTTCIVHFFGRIGCFMAGCCYGRPTDGVLGVVFSDPACKARPLGEPLHPSQLYEAGIILLILVAVLAVKRMARKFFGQLFLLYLILYAVGRSVLELFRGDTSRGFIIPDVLSHSQLIALVIVIVTIIVYRRWSNNRALQVSVVQSKKK
jgi:phosphatidylglycerol:prolipoprotein diacylglycerol transferase